MATYNELCDCIDCYNNYKDTVPTIKVSQVVSTNAENDYIDIRIHFQNEDDTSFGVDCQLQRAITNYLNDQFPALFKASVPIVKQIFLDYLADEKDSYTEIANNVQTLIDGVE